MQRPAWFRFKRHMQCVRPGPGRTANRLQRPPKSWLLTPSGLRAPVWRNEETGAIRGFGERSHFARGIPGLVPTPTNCHVSVRTRLIRHLQRRGQRLHRPAEGKSFYAGLHDLGLRPL